jgi:hypothetical protein
MPFRIVEPFVQILLIIEYQEFTFAPLPHLIDTLALERREVFNLSWEIEF